MLGLYSFVIKLPEDGTPVPKDVGISYFYELYFIKCFCWLVYYM